MDILAFILQHDAAAVELGVLVAVIIGGWRILNVLKSQLEANIHRDRDVDDLKTRIAAHEKDCEVRAESIYKQLRHLNDSAVKNTTILERLEKRE